MTWDEGDQTADICGVLERCKQLVEAGYNVNKRDAENLTLLHWASLNNRKEIVNYYISQNAVVDAVGGVVSSTPLHWAIKQGLLQMVVLLMKHGADPQIRDGEGYSGIHLAAQYGHTSIIAYLVAKGVPPDAPDKNKMTALMWAVGLVDGVDPCRLLLSCGASPSIQDKLYGNTAIHWAIIAGNKTAIHLMINYNPNMDIPNYQGVTPFAQLVLERPKWLNHKVFGRLVDKYVPKKDRGYVGRIKDSKRIRKYSMVGLPFTVLLLLGCLFNADSTYLVKSILLGVIALFVHLIAKYLFDDNAINIVPISSYLSTKKEMGTLDRLGEHLALYVYQFAIYLDISLCVFMRSFELVEQFSWNTIFKHYLLEDRLDYRVKCGDEVEKGGDNVLSINELMVEESQSENMIDIHH
ncbi:hypothetical protein QYM36_016821 [Artemia franciscana]|uniref:Palmitoyltransferase n=1 Tax=Artemia franciscana TaxID=6661 RepID=A0AA88H4A5_ARTSF|nr:hypothetical protein QYM36_016821 [Artemia franciscana]